MVKKLNSLTLAVAISLISLMGCGNQEKEMEYVQSFSESVICEELGKDYPIGDLSTFSDEKGVRVFFCANKYEGEEYVNCWGFLDINSIGKRQEFFSEDGERGSYIKKVKALSKEYVVLLKNEEFTESIIEVRDVANNIESNYIFDCEEEALIENIIVADDSIYAENQEKLYCFDRELNLKKCIMNDLNHIEYFCGADGQLYEEYYSEVNKKKVALFNPSIEERVELDIKEEDDWYPINESSNICRFDFYNKKGIYAFENDNTIKEIMNFENSYINVGKYGMFKVISEDKILCLKYSYEGSGDNTTCELVSFDKQSDEQLKKRVVLGCLESSNELEYLVYEFNKKNPEYKIVIKDYSEYASEDSPYGDVEALNLDLTGKNKIDILLINSDINIREYMIKDVFEDLSFYMKKDEQIDKSDLFSCAVELGSVEERMYLLIPQINVTTVLGKKSIFGDRRGWNFDEFKEFRDKNREKQLFYDESRDYILSCLLQVNMNTLVDYKKGKCYFDSSTFKDVLELSKNLSNKPIEIDYLGEKKATAFRTDDNYLLPVSITSLNQYEYYLRVIFGEEITPIGYPSDDRNGTACGYKDAYAIIKSSKNKDVAWKFIREMLLDDYQDNYVYEIPVTMGAFDRRAEKEIEKGPTVYYIGNTEMEIAPLTKEEVSDFKAFLNNINKGLGNDREIENIVCEEAEYYFRDVKSDEEVASIIQSRAQIMVDEKNR